MAILLNLSNEMKRERFDVCLTGFGLGLSWSSMLLKLGRLDFCDLTDYREP